MQSEYQSLVQSGEFLGSLQVAVLLDEWVLQHCVRVWPLGRVLFQHETHKAAQLGRPNGHFEVVVDDLGKVIAVLDLEGVLGGGQLVGDRPEGPDVHLLVVGLADQHLRGQVERSAAERGAELLWTVGGPAEVADLGHALQSTMFSSLISRWMMLCRCIYRTPSAISRTKIEVASSEKALPLEVNAKRCPSVASQMSRQTLRSSQKQSQIAMMLGCRRKNCILISVASCPIDFSVSFSVVPARLSLFITFIAATNPLARCLTKKTSPNRPVPSLRNTLNSLNRDFCPPDPALGL